MNRIIGIAGTIVTSIAGCWFVVHGVYAGIVRRKVRRTYRPGDYAIGRSAVAEGIFRVIVGAAIIALNVWLVISGRLL